MDSQQSNERKNRRNANELQQLLLLIAELRKTCGAEAHGAPATQNASA